MNGPFHILWIAEVWFIWANDNKSNWIPCIASSANMLKALTYHCYYYGDVHGLLTYKGQKICDCTWMYICPDKFCTPLLWILFDIMTIWNAFSTFIYINGWSSNNENLKNNVFILNSIWSKCDHQMSMYWKINLVAECSKNGLEKSINAKFIQWIFLFIISSAQRINVIVIVDISKVDNNVRIILGFIQKPLQPEFPIAFNYFKFLASLGCCIYFQKHFDLISQWGILKMHWEFTQKIYFLELWKPSSNVPINIGLKHWCRKVDDY